MHIVTGATGQLGRRIVENLLLHIPADRIGISVRDPGQAKDLAAMGVRVRQADYRDRTSLMRAWDGASRLLLISSNAAATGGDPLAQHETAIGVAREIGVGRVFYTSQVSSSPNSLFPPGRDHAATEEMLSKSGLAWTALRHGFYSGSAMMMNVAGFRSGVLAAPEDGKVAWTTHDDLAAADAVLLAGRRVIDGPTPPLTGSEALDLADLAALASSITGRTITRQIISEEEMLNSARSHGAPEGALEVMQGYYRAARAGEFSATGPALADIIARDPQDMRSVMSAELAAPHSRPAD